METIYQNLVHPDNINLSKPKHGLGRMPSIDLRDHRFLATPLLPKKVAGITYRTWVSGTVLDQKQTSECTSYSALQFLMSSPIRNAITKLNPNSLYKEIQKNDEWPGENYDGSSVRAAMKVLQIFGYLDSYNWAYSIETCAQWILQIGPMVLGTIWTEEMFYPDGNNYIHIESQGNSAVIVGGHAYAVVGVNTTIKNPDKSKGRFTILNSWGKSYGANGRVYISFEDMKILLDEDGEAACAKEIKVV